MEEKRGPIEKGEKGWPINPLGVAALVVFTLVVLLLILRPLLSKKSIPQETVSARLVSPAAGSIIKSNSMPIVLSVDNPQDVGKVQFWVKIYAENKWEMIGETTQSPYQLDWQIPENYRNKSVAITSHIFDKKGNTIKDPGGWKEGIIILAQ